MIEEGAPGFRESMYRKRSSTLLKKGREYFQQQEPDGKLRFKACAFVTPEDVSAEIIQLHHLYPILDAGEDGSAMPFEEAVKKLLPLCPNCHAIVHTATPPIRAFIRLKC